MAQLRGRVPMAGGFDAPGNLGTGRQWIARANLDLPLARLGMTGGRMGLSRSSVDPDAVDPYIFANRLFSGNSLFFQTSEFRQDLVSSPGMSA